MTCRHTRVWLDPYLDEALEPQAAAEMEEHLAGCPACSARVRAERLIRGRLAALVGLERAPAALRERVHAQVRAAVPEVQARVPEDELRRPEYTVEDAHPSSAAILPPLPLHGRGRSWLRGGMALAAVLAAILGLWLIAPRTSVAEVWAAELAEDHRVHHGEAGTSFLLEETSPAELAWRLERDHGVRVTLPDPPAEGRLIGGQLCYVADHWVAHAVYEVGGRTISYFVLPEVPGPDGVVEGSVSDLGYVGWDGPAGGVFVLGPGSADGLAEVFLPD